MRNLKTEVFTILGIILAFFCLLIGAITVATPSPYMPWWYSIIARSVIATLGIFLVLFVFTLYGRKVKLPKKGGEEEKKLICPSCGAENKPTNVYCKECQKKLKKE